MAELHGKTTVIYVDQYDVSAWMTSADETSERDKAETSAFMDTVKQYVPGLADGNMALQGNFDGGTVGTTIDGILGPRAGGTVVVASFPRGDLVAGYEVDLMAGVLKTYSPESSITDATKFAAGVHGGGPYPGIVISPRQAFTVTGNGTSVDNGALSSFGGRAQIHVLLNSMNNTTDFKFQHSVDNSAWTDLVAFTQVPAATLYSAHVAVTGTVNRYLRLVRTAAGTGSITVTAAFWRANS